MWEKAKRLCDDVMQMHRLHARDAGDSMLMAYDQGTFTKVVEFVAFKERLHRSYTRAQAALESHLMRLRFGAPPPSGY